MEQQSKIYLILLLLTSSIFTRSANIPLSAAYLLTSMVYTVVIFYIYRKDGLRLIGSKYAVLFISIIYLIQVSHITWNAFIGHHIISATLRTTTYVIFTSLGIFLIPYILDPDKFLWIISRFSVIMVLIGLPTAFIGSYSLAGLEVTPWRWGYNLPLIFISPEFIQPVKGVFDNPNLFGLLASVGLISSLGILHLSQRKKISISFAVLNFIGVYLSGSRTAVFTAIFGTVLYLAYIHQGKRSVALIAFSVFSFWILFFIMFFELLPGPGIIQSVNLRGREYIWPATIEAVKTQPLFGHGAGAQSEFIRPFIEVEKYKNAPTNNSFLRMFLTTGILGGISYILFTGHVILSSLKSSDSIYSMSIVIIIMMITIHEFFASFSLFGSVGLSFISILTSIFFGYGIRVSLKKECIKRKIPINGVQT